VNAVYAILVLGGVPAGVEILKRRLVGPHELLRKAVHIGDGLLVAPLPLLLSFRAIAGIGLLFAGLMALSRRWKIFTAVHDVERRTFGEILYPLGIALLATLFPHWHPFLYGVLVIALADGLAAPIGIRFGRRRLPGGKSVWGSATFLAISICAGLVVLLADGTSPVVAITTAAFAALVLTVVEASLRHGVDNLVLPPLAAFLIGTSVTPLLVAQALYVVAPVVVAGVVHGFVIKNGLVRTLAHPLDGGRTLGGRPIFGRNKTWRGVVVMSLVSTLVVFAQRLLYSHEAFRSVSVVDYRTSAALVLGIALGLGYSLGELPNSFLKRRLEIAPGGHALRGAGLQYVVDQADSAVGVVLGLLFFVRDPGVLALAFTCGLGVHVVADCLFYTFGVKQRETAPRAASAVAGTT
jgi:dolichol kinase